MLTEIFLPKSELAHVVRCYISSSTPPDSASCNFKRFRILSEGCPELIFHFGKPPQKLLSGDTSASTASSLLMGLYLRHVDVQLCGPCQTLFVQFQPWTQAWLLGDVATQATDAQMDLDDVFCHWERDFMDRIRLTTNPQAAIPLIEAWLSRRLNSLVTDRQVIHAAALLQDSGGNIPIQTLEAKVNLGIRRLEQRFTDHVGVGMKYYARIVRIRRTAEAIREQQGLHLTAIGYDHGFFDQSHLIREFRHFAAMTPTIYARAI